MNSYKMNTTVVEQVSDIEPTTQSGLARISPIKKIFTQSLDSPFPTTTRLIDSASQHFPATELGFLSGSTVVSLLLNNCDLEARRRMH